MKIKTILWRIAIVLVCILNMHKSFATKLDVTTSNSPYTVSTIANWDSIEVFNGGLLRVTGTLNNTKDYFIVRNGGNVVVQNPGVLKMYGSMWVDGGGKVKFKDGVTVRVGNNSFIFLRAGTPSTITTPTVAGAILETGAALITGYTPTSTWKGIYVTSRNWYFPQTNPIFNYSQQSSLPSRALLSSTIITNSKYGVSNCDPEYLNGGATALFQFLPETAHQAGGVIKARGCTFQNNRISSYLLPYKNYYYDNTKTALQNYNDNFNNPRNEASFFSGCIFKQTATTLFQPETFIAAKGIYGLKILGCYFKDETHNMAHAAVEANDASMTIDQLCTGVSTGTGTCISSVPSKFEGMSVGVNALGAPSVMPFTVINTSFQDIYQHGIVITGYSGAVVKNNHIKLYQNTLDYYAGIIMQGSSEFRIEENSVTSNITNPDLAEYTYGIVVNNSGEGSEQVYKNTLGTSSLFGAGSLKYALQANGNNYNVHNKEIGLKLFCNKMRDNLINVDNYDVLVAPTGTTASGIAKIQGDPFINTLGNVDYIAAENIYGGRSYYAFVNFNDFHIFSGTYFNSTDTLAYKVSSVTRSPTFYDTSIMGNTYFCDSNYCLSNSFYGGSSTSSTAAFKLARTSLGNNISATSSQQYDANGNNKHQAYIAKYTQLNSDMMHRYLYTATPVLPSRLIDSLDATTDTLIIRNDSTRINIDSVRMVLEDAEYIHSYRFWLASMYAKEKNFALAYASLNNLPNDFYSLTTEQQNEINNIHDLIAIADTLNNNGGHWDSLALVKRTWVSNIAANGIRYPRYWARYYMATYTGTYYEPDLNIVTDPEERSLSANSLQLSSSGIQMYPNPVLDQLTVVIQNLRGDVSIALFDIAGRKIIDQKAHDGNNNVQVRQLAQGIYIVRVTQDNKIITTQNIVKQ